jgi:hypothetical protein
MSLLTLPIPGFDKAVISLWFRVPQASMVAAHEAYSQEAFQSDPLNGTLALMVMGERGSDGTAPTYIGLDCANDASTATLIVNFASNQKGTVSGVSFEADTVAILCAAGPVISADVWHHALISVDFSSSMDSHGWGWDEDVSEDINDHFASVAHLYMALDDVNMVGTDLTGDTIFGYDDQNAVVSSDCSSVANSIQSVAPFEPGVPPHPDGPIPSYSGTLTVPDGSMGLPGNTEFVDDIYRVELAEFQMWTGVMLNTGSAANRRAFVDADGLPVAPDGTEDDPRAPAEKLLGKKPDIILHGSSNWIAGLNTGASGVDADGNQIPLGQFEPTGGIEAFTPDPSLHGESG